MGLGSEGMHEASVEASPGEGIGGGSADTGAGIGGGGESDFGGWAGYENIAFSGRRGPIDIETGQPISTEQAGRQAISTGLGGMGQAALESGRGLMTTIGGAQGALATMGMSELASGGVSRGIGQMQSAADIASASMAAIESGRNLAASQSLERSGYSFEGVEPGQNVSIGGQQQGGEIDYAIYRNNETGDTQFVPISKDQSAQLQTNIATSTPGGLGQMFLERYRDIYAPLQEDIITEAQREDVPGLARMLANIDKYYSDVAANQRRTLGGQYQYGGGLPQMAQLTTELQRARAKSGTAAQMQQEAEQRRFANMLAAAGLGQQLPGLAASGIGQQTQADIQRAALESESERFREAQQQELWSGLAGGLKDLATMYFEREKKPETTTTTPAQTTFTGDYIQPAAAQATPTAPTQVESPYVQSGANVGETGTTAWGF